MNSRRATAGGVGLGFAVGWNITNVGAVAEPLAEAYGVDLAVVGLFTTSLFLVHSLVQIPSGRRADRVGAYPVGLAAALVIATGNALALITAQPALALLARALTGLGSGAGFVAGSDYVRAAGGGAVAQGLFGGSAMLGGGAALAVVPVLNGWLEWRSPYVSACAVALAATALLVLSPRGRPTRLHEAAAPLGELVADRRLHGLSVVHMASLGLNAVVANWTVTLLVRAGNYGLAVAGVASALTLAAGIVSRPLGGMLVGREPERTSRVVLASLLMGALGTALLAAAEPLALVLPAAALVGLGAGLAFAPVFGAAARARPDAPGAAVGLVNMAGNFVIVGATPLLGLAFALPGDGRIGFLGVALLWAAAALVLRRPPFSR
jgi:MFS family permease